MTEGLRERKKRRTRRELADAAHRLVAAQGYAATTVAQIAAAAEVSPRTFFSYFAAKEDALFLDTDERLALLDGLAFPGPPLGPAQSLVAVLGQVLDATAVDLFGQASARRLAALPDAPELAAAGLRRLQTAQRRLAARLLEAFPGELSRGDAATLTGAAVGALVAAVSDGLADPDAGHDEVRARAARALALVERGAAVLPAPVLRPPPGAQNVTSCPSDG